MFDLEDKNVIKLSILLAAAMKGVVIDEGCDCFHRAPDDSTKCQACGLDEECHS